MTSKDNFKNTINSFLKKQAEVLEELLFTNTLSMDNLCLRKLPILSSVHKNGKVDFEWPSKPEANEMLKHSMFKLSKIEIWYYPEYNFMTGIRATLSNGKKSPIFKTNGEQAGPFTMSIDGNKRPKMLAVRSQEEGVYGLRVTDKDR